MTRFLEKVATEVVVNNFYDSTIVLPTRRSCLYLKQEISGITDKIIFAPEILSIEDFVEKYSGVKIIPRLEIIFTLFEIYKNYADEPFDKFYPWGEILLNDFEDIDKNLVDADRLFRITYEHKKLEEDFALNVEDLAYYTEFWKTFSNRELKKDEKYFLELWKIAGNLYNELYLRFTQANCGHSGFAERILYQKIITNNLSFAQQKIIFAGLNYLTKAEEKIIGKLIKDNKAITYWDTDSHYTDVTNNFKHEAGYFLRKNFINFKIGNPAWIANSLSGNKKEIEIIGAPLIAGQVKTAGSILFDLLKDKLPELSKTALIIPEERSLIPLMNSLPYNINKFNVTLGYGLAHTSAYSFISILASLYKNKNNSGEFYYKDVLEFLSHQYIELLNKTVIEELVYKIKNKTLVYIKKDFITNELINSKDLLGFETDGSYPGLLRNYCGILLNEYEKGNRYFEREVVNKFIDSADSLNSFLIKFELKLEIDTIFSLLKQIFKYTRLPFSGEPLEGLQIMGLLESRALDFRNLIIINVNEGILPSTPSGGSFIPFNLRKAFGLNTYKEEDAIQSYYFYRLLQRAERIFLIYNTEEVSISSGEKSRFILQLEEELKIHNPKHKIINLGNPKPVETSIEIQKSDEIIDKLKTLNYSASSLNSFINCSLQFYFKFIADIREEIETEESFSSAVFGRILHGIMELLYINHLGQTLSKSDLKEIKYKLNSDYDLMLREIFSRDDELKNIPMDLKGRNLLLKGVIYKLVLKILDADLERVPFKITELEKTLKREFILKDGTTVKLKGKIDRIDEKDEITEILDYKTSSKDFKKYDSKKIIDEPDFSETFQLMLYLYLFRNKSSIKNVKLGLYKMRTLSKGIKWAELNDEFELDFEKQLNTLMNTIFAKDKSFKQTTEEERCTFCSYKSICYRD